jgi:hypothetical protein
MKKQTSNFRKALEKEAEFVFVDAPFKTSSSYVMDSKVIEFIEGDHLSWFPVGFSTF